MKFHARLSEKQLSLWLLCIVLIGIGARTAHVNRPLGYQLQASWRQADEVQLARNFYRDGMNIFYPRIDWRGDTPGYVEMEFPVYPWLVALLYHIFGYHEAFLRLLSAILESASLLLFVRLCRQVLPPIGVLFAVAAFALNPLLVYLATAMQPDPWMLGLILVAVALIWRWQAKPKHTTLLGAAAVIAAAILVKAPAAYLGFVFAYVVLRHYRWQAFSTIWVYLAVLIALAPPLAWYTWAHHFWTLYGNSLGLSNESHFIGWDMVVPPSALLGNLKWETLAVFTPLGWLLAAAALRAPSVWSEPALVWYAAVWVFYIVAARTTAMYWAFYYHCVSVAPACLLMGTGVAAFDRGWVLPRGWHWLKGREFWCGRVLAVSTIVALIGATVILLRTRDGRTDHLQMQTCALQFVQHVPPTASIVVKGGYMLNEQGYPAAHNESMLFAWMDRRGFTYGIEELSIATLDRIAARGGRYWVVQRSELEPDHLQALVDQRYRLVAACPPGYFLYDLQPSR